MKTHTEEKLFTCEICWSAFLKSDTLIRHLQTRTREKPYFCEVCKCGCSDESTLKDHIQVHMGEKPFSYEMCKITFFRSSLKKHQYTLVTATAIILYPSVFVLRR